MTPQVPSHVTSLPEKLGSRKFGLRSISLGLLAQVVSFGPPPLLYYLCCATLEHCLQQYSVYDLGVSTSEFEYHPRDSTSIP